jgi:hypothetical protein
MIKINEEIVRVFGIISKHQEAAMDLAHTLTCSTNCAWRSMTNVQVSCVNTSGRLSHENWWLRSEKAPRHQGGEERVGTLLNRSLM